VPVLLPARISCCAGGVYAGLSGVWLFLLGRRWALGSGAGTTQFLRNASCQKSRRARREVTRLGLLPLTLGRGTPPCMVALPEWRDSSCAAFALSQPWRQARHGPCAFTTRVWVSSRNAGLCFRPRSDRDWNADDHALGCAVGLIQFRLSLGTSDMHTTLEQRAGNDTPMHAWNTQSVNCPEPPAGVA